MKYYKVYKTGLNSFTIELHNNKIDTHGTLRKLTAHQVNAIIDHARELGFEDQTDFE